MLALPLRSTLKVPGRAITRAKFPFIDVHGHQQSPTPERLAQLVSEMDALNMAVMVDLSGGTGDRLAQKTEAYRQCYGNRFVVFANLNFNGIDQPGWGERAAAQLEQDVRVHGAKGLKIFKNLGMEVHDARGRVPTDDPRLDPVWAKAGELGIPVLIHTAEPAPFFQPSSRTTPPTSAWLELKLHPQNARPPERYPPWETLMNEQWNVFRKHPRTKFISAHMAWLGGDLDRLGKLLDELPNMYVELGAVIAEIGRQPRAAKRFFTRWEAQPRCLGDGSLSGALEWPLGAGGKRKTRPAPAERAATSRSRSNSLGAMVEPPEGGEKGLAALAAARLLRTTAEARHRASRLQLPVPCQVRQFDHSMLPRREWLVRRWRTAHISAVTILPPGPRRRFPDARCGGPPSVTPASPDSAPAASAARP